jgi:hypothetical protein
MRGAALRRLLWLAIIAGGLSPAVLAAQTIEIVHAFPVLPERPVGRLLQVADNVFIGASARGGLHDRGAVYALYRQGDLPWTAVVLHSFAGPDGEAPASGLMRASDGNIYGTTYAGGAFAGRRPSDTSSPLH